MTDPTPDHTPSSPFGCPQQWGPVVGGWLPDMRRHVCDIAENHNGPHVCHCGHAMTQEATDDH